MKKLFLLLLCFLPLSVTYAQNWDVNTLKRVNSWDGNFVRNYSKAISNTTPFIVAGIPTALATYALISDNKPLLKDAIYIGTSVGEAFVITYGLKYAVNRTRPYDKYPDKITLVGGRESSPSFPSAHTATAFSFATSLCIKYPKWYVIAPSAVWAGSVAFARMNQGVHYPSDVLGGAAIGVGCAFANVYVNKWLNGWLFPKERKVAGITY